MGKQVMQDVCRANRRLVDLTKHKHYVESPEHIVKIKAILASLEALEALIKRGMQRRPDDMTLRELRALASRYLIPYYGKLSKEKLLLRVKETIT